MARILIAEDTLHVARLVEYKLTQHGHEVSIAGDGVQALEMAKASPPDLCILDVMMPGMDGYRVLASLRADPLLQHVPVIMLTSLADDSNVVRGLRAGANDYVVKPFSSSELVARVDRLLAA
jgi:DNA-binding response OmpR family regulator